MKTLLQTLLPLGAVIAVLAACGETTPAKSAADHEARPVDAGRPAPTQLSPTAAPMANAPSANGTPPTWVGAPQGSTANDAAAADATRTPAPGTPGASTEGALLPQRDQAAMDAARSAAPDDSGRNKREDGSQPTPLDQGNGQADTEITRAIRQAVNERTDLSFNAKNIKIISRNGMVTLRGPVANGAERDAIATMASSQTGVQQVDNQLEPAQR